MSNFQKSAIHEDPPKVEKTKSRWDWVKKPPVLATAILAPLILSVGIVQGQLFGITKRLDTIEDTKRTNDEKMSFLQSHDATRETDIRNINQILWDLKKTVDELYKSFSGVKNVPSKREFQRSFSVALISTKPGVDSHELRVQKTHIIDASTKTIHTFVTPAVDDQQIESNKLLLVGRAFKEDVSCNRHSA